MSGRRVADTAVTHSGELVEALLHVFHPLLLCVSDALTTAAAVTPLEVAAGVGVADGRPQGTASLLPGAETGASTATTPTLSTQDAAGAQLITETTSSMAPECAASASSPLILDSAKGAPPPPADTTSVFCAAEEAEVRASEDNSGSDTKAARQRPPTSLEQDKLRRTGRASDGGHRDGGDGVDSDVAKAPTAAPCCVAQKGSIATCLQSSTSSLPNPTSVSSTLVPATSDKAPATSPRKRSRLPQSHSATARVKRETTAKVSVEPLPHSATPPPYTTLPFCFTVPNAVLWEAVAALAEAVLIDGACFSWLQGEVQRRTDAEPQHGKGPLGAKTGLSFSSPARVLADALLNFGHSSVAAAHMRWRELAVSSKDGTGLTGNGSLEPSEVSSSESSVFSALPAELQDNIFTAVSVALIRAATVQTAQLLSPLCVAHLDGAGLTQKGGGTAGPQQDVSAPAQSRGIFPCLSEPPRTAARVAPLDDSSAAVPPLQAADGGLCTTGGPFFLWQQWAEQGVTGGAEGFTDATGAPLTFRMVQEKVKQHNRRTLQAQQMQQSRPAPMSATVSRSPATMSPASAALVAPRASGPRGDVYLATTTGAPFTTAAAGQPPSRVAESPLALRVRQAEEQDLSCFYVQVNTSGPDAAPRGEATAASTRITAGRSSEFTLQVLCSALASFMTDDVPASTLHDGANQGMNGFVDGGAAAGSTDTAPCARRVKKERGDESSTPHWLAGDARCCLVRQWCAGLEQLACITSSTSTWNSTSWRTAQRPRHSNFARSAASLFAYLRDSSVNPQLALLADYALGTGKGSSASSRAPHPSPREIRDAHAAAAGTAAATVSTAAHQLPWATAQWSVRPVVDVEEVDHVAGPPTRSKEHHRAHVQGVTVLPLLPTDTASDAYPLTRPTSSALIDTDSPEKELPELLKMHADQAASASPRLMPAVEWLRLSEAHGHPSESDQSEDGHGKPPSPRLPLTQVVERSTAALFHRALAPHTAGRQDDARISTDVVNPLEEVGTVLATLDAVCAGRTLVDSSAWRYGRNRMNVAAVSSIRLAVPQSENGGTAEQRKDAGTGHGSLTETHGSPLGLSTERAALQSAEEGPFTVPVPVCSAWQPLGLYCHESGVLHVVDGATYALEID
ncbi:hypothetical protein, unknown function [Leishmania tarentolae]|uniref:Uncharacterized protein n=1 Tax=Leishmania tarentolae TaxID=5689 RepID=A0A640KDP0_LEITA|nr:hypothetical protein, unknown function [Leishmania tarentolae]